MEGISKRLRSRAVALQNTSQFGPGCRPMFYTALLNQPQWLGWCPIANMESGTVLLEDVETGAPVWSETALDNDGFQWRVPELNLTRGRVYQWRVQPPDAGVPVAGLFEECSHSFPTIPVADRLARFWLISLEGQARFVAGLDMLRERADPAFLVIAEALYLAEFQMYHHALARLPVGRNRGSLALSALVATTRSVIFKQMGQHIKQSSGTPACFLEWAELNEQYHRNETETRLRDVDIQQHQLCAPWQCPRRTREKRTDPPSKLRSTMLK